MTRRDAFKAAAGGILGAIFGAVGLGKAKAEPKIEFKDEWPMFKRESPHWEIKRYDCPTGRWTEIIGNPPFSKWSSDR